MSTRLARSLAVVVTTVGICAVAVPSALAAGGGSVRGLHPDHGPAGTVTVIHLAGFTPSAPATVTFDGSATPVTATVSPTERISAAVPDDAATGPVTVTQGAVSAQSQTPFTITLPSRLSTAVSGTDVTYPDPVTVTGDLRDANGPVTRAWLHVQSRHRGSRGWHAVTGLRPRQTDAAGVAAWRIRPAQATRYRVTFAGTDADAPAHGGATPRVSVAPRLRLHAGRNLPVLTTVPLTGSIAPALPGVIAIQQRTGGSWHTLIRTKARKGGFSASASFSHTGPLDLRAIRHGDGRHALATSRVLHARVVHRTLQEGQSGTDVRRLQHRLARLHYDVGAVNGSFGFDLFHAVTAFQKVQGLPDDGQVGTATWTALNHPRRMHLKHPISGTTAVEVSLTRQVVMLAKDGKIWRIIDSSTAGGYYYTNSSGQSEKAVTPEGHFSVQYKQDGWQTSDLGQLYRPAYFTNTGYAIHGETEVPPYPASHGCVRITVPAMDRYYDDFFVGESVWIYGNPPPGHE